VRSTANEEDCGAACLATIAKYYGKTFTITRVREAIGTGQQGTTLLGLKRGAAKLGFNARGGRAAAEILEKMMQYNYQPSSTGRDITTSFCMGVKGKNM
jgi:ATP-binding cassette subfamily C protein